MKIETLKSRVSLSALCAVCFASSSALVIAQTGLLATDEESEQGSIPYVSPSQPRTTELAAQEAEAEQSSESATAEPAARPIPVEGTRRTARSGDSDDVFILDDFVVTTEGDIGYYSANTASATRTNALVRNTPITLTIINEQMMEDLNILNDQDLARATASVSEDPDGFSFNQLRIRGFRSLTQRYDLFWREIPRDGYNIQRVDIVKGANSLMFGQADPGGQINSVPKVAQFNEDFVNVRAMVGTNNFTRAEVDVNHVVNDQFAVRVMGFDSSRELDQLYEFSDLSGATIETSWRPTNRSQFRARVEYIELDQNLVPNMFSMTGGDLRFAGNSRASETDIPTVFTLGAFRNEFIYSPDAIRYIPQPIIDDLRLNPDYAASIGVAPTEVTRDVLRQILSPWASQDDRYSVTGPDKYNRREGLITTLEWSQRLSDTVQAKVAFNREANDTESLARDGYSAGRVVSDNIANANAFDPGNPRPFDPYINTFWRKQQGRTEANALKSTLLWDLEFNNNIPVLRDSEHKFLVGFDWDNLSRDPRSYEQLREGTVLKDGQFFSGNDILNERFYLSDGFGPSTPNIGYNGRDDLFVLRDDNNLEVDNKSLWFALQSSFFDGRLRTLFGLRYDYIDIDYTLQSNKYGTNDAFVNNNLGGDFSRATNQLIDQNRTFEQTSPSAGALFWLTKDLAIFGNYARSIQAPTGINVDPLGEMIPPVYGEGYEVGIRFDMFDRKLTGQITAFYIEKENDNIVNYDFRLSDIYTFEKFGETNPGIFNPNNGNLVNDLLPGKQVPGDVSRSQGIEVEFYYNPNRNLSFTVSYAYTDLEAVKINENVNPRFAQVFGQAPHNLLLIGRYTFTDGRLRGLTVGANQSFRSSSTIGAWYIEADGVPQGEGTWYDIKFDPEYTTDAFINYRRRLGSGPRATMMNVGLRVNNIFDNTDLINRNKNAFHRNSRQVMLSAGLRF